MASPAKGKAPTNKRPASDGSTTRQVVWTLFASAVAGLSGYYYTLPKGSTSVTSLPASYALCSEDKKIYTVDHARPTVDCVLVDKVIIAATGSLGGYQQGRHVSCCFMTVAPHTASVQSYWDEYQNELIRKWYGNEPSAKKPLPVYNVLPGSIIIPGLTGTRKELPTAVCYTQSTSQMHTHILCSMGLRCICLLTKCILCLSSLTSSRTMCANTRPDQTLG